MCQSDPENNKAAPFWSVWSFDQMDVHYDVPTDLLKGNNTGTSHPKRKSWNGSLEDGVNANGEIDITVKSLGPI